MQLERLKLPAPVERIGILAFTTAPLEQRQSNLFAEQIHQTRQQLGLLINRLSTRLTRQRVLQPQLCADAQPERTCCYLPLAGEKRRVGIAHLTKQSSRLAERPLQLLSPPLSLEVLAIIPDGPPIRFSYSGRQHQVAKHWGPERIETGWWRGRSVRRDYYRVETQTGNRFWLFRRVENGAWFLHGQFD